MVKSKEINMNLPSADDLFTTQEERDQKNQEHVKNISVYEISDFPNHPFKVKMDDKMVETIESIREHGVLVPALVREKPTGGYEMISGHRRKMASELAGLENIPCIVRNLSDDEAVIVMVDSNLQREEILPSEKAFAYKMKLDVMKRQGQRTDLTSSPLATKLKGKRSDELLGEEVGESKDQIRRYIRLTYLIPEILDMVDNKKIAMRPAVELSYLPKEEQEILYDTMESEDCTPSHAQAIKIRKFSVTVQQHPGIALPGNIIADNVYHGKGCSLNHHIRMHFKGVIRTNGTLLKRSNGNAVKCTAIRSKIGVLCSSKERIFVLDLIQNSNGYNVLAVQILHNSRIGGNRIGLLIGCSSAGANLPAIFHFQASAVTVQQEDLIGMGVCFDLFRRNGSHRLSRTGSCQLLVGCLCCSSCFR